MDSPVDFGNQTEHRNVHDTRMIVHPDWESLATTSEDEHGDSHNCFADVAGDVLTLAFMFLYVDHTKSSCF